MNHLSFFYGKYVWICIMPVHFIFHKARWTSVECRQLFISMHWQMNCLDRLLWLCMFCCHLETRVSDKIYWRFSRAMHQWSSPWLQLGRQVDCFVSKIYTLYFYDNSFHVKLNILYTWRIHNAKVLCHKHLALSTSACHIYHFWIEHTATCRQSASSLLAVLT